MDKTRYFFFDRRVNYIGRALNIYVKHRCPFGGFKGHLGGRMDHGIHSIHSDLKSGYIEYIAFYPADLLKYLGRNKKGNGLIATDGFYSVSGINEIPDHISSQETRSSGYKYSR